LPHATFVTYTCVSVYVCLTYLQRDKVEASTLQFALVTMQFEMQFYAIARGEFLSPLQGGFPYNA